MAVNQRDVLQVLTTALMDSSALTALVAGRIRGAWPLDFDAQTTDYPLVVVQAMGGGRPHYNGVVATESYMLIAASRRSAGEAAQVHDAARGALQAERFTDSTSGMVIVCRMTSTPAAGYDDDHRVHLYSSQWSIGVSG